MTRVIKFTIFLYQYGGLKNSNKLVEIFEHGCHLNSLMLTNQMGKCFVELIGMALARQDTNWTSF